MTPTINHRDFSLDLIRVLACIAVIFLHVTARPIYLQGQISESGWFVANALSSLSHWCVPVFVMLSGALLLNKIQPWSLIYKKRIPRILLVTVLISIVYAFWRVYFHNEVLFPIFWKDLAINGAYYHLYYLYVVIGLYVITPIATIVVDKLSREEFFYTILTLCLVSTFSFSFSTFTSTYQPNASVFAWPFISYFALGFFLYKHPLSLRNSVSFTIFGYAITFLGTQYLATTYGPEWTWRLYFYTYFSPSTFLLSIGVFSLILSLHNHEINITIKRIINSISTYTLLVYLLHPMVMESLRRFYTVYAPDLMNLYIELPLTFFATVFLSFMISYTIKRIPLIF